MNWLERWRQRQDLLSHGVDADLIRDNQKRYRVAFGLLGFGFLLSVLLSKVEGSPCGDCAIDCGRHCRCLLFDRIRTCCMGKAGGSLLEQTRPRGTPKNIQVMVPKLPISGLIGPSTQNPRHWRDRVVSCSFVIMCDVESDEAYMASCLGISFCRAAPNASPTINQFAAR